MFITSRDGVHLHVKDLGKGHPVILIHGWPLTGDMWEYQKVTLLESGYRVITYDRRGFGQSTHGVEGFNYDALADDLSAIIHKLDEPCFSLVGFSMGGGEVARYMARYGSARIDRVALVSSVVPYMLKDDSSPHGVEAPVFEDIKKQLYADRFDFLQNFTKNFYGIGKAPKTVSNGILDWTFALAMMAEPIATIKCVDAFANTDFRPDLEKIDVPTLIIHGTADDIVPIDASARAAAAGIACSRLIEYDGEPHGLFATAAERLSNDLLTFLDGDMEMPGTERATVCEPIEA